MFIKSTLIMAFTAVAVAGFTLATKDHDSPEDKIKLAKSARIEPQAMLAADNSSAGGSSGQPADLQALADHIQAAAPSAVLSDTPAKPANTTAADSVAQASPEQAQPQATQPTSPQQSNPAQAADNQPKVDESALRYFASRGDKARLQAEISRLQALYPNWRPPADPLAIPQNSDKQLEAMWQLYSEGRYAEVRKALADRQTSEPGWQPPADLLERLDIAEARTRLVNASDLKQYQTVIDIGARTPSLLTCSDIDVLWRVAEAFIRTDRAARGQDAYKYILKTCTNPQERLATIQKAAALLPYQPMQDLLALERPDGNGGREFDSIRTDLARRFVAQGNDDPKLVVSQDYLSQVERVARSQGLASDDALLGWYYLRRSNYPDAEQWFKAAHEKEDSATISQGLALVLIADRKPQEAEDAMYKWRNESKDAMATYLAATANLMALQPPANLSEDALGRIAAEVVKQKYVPTAQQFGWFARSMNQPQAAARWFETALRWKPDDEPSAYGLAITRNQLNDRVGVAEVQRLWAGRSQRIAVLGEPAPRTPTSEPLPSPNQAGQSAPQALPQTSMQQGAAQNVPPAISQAAPQPPVTRPYVNAQMPEQPIAPTRSAPSQDYAEPQARARVATRSPRKTAGCKTTVNAQALTPGNALSRGWCLMNLNRPMEAVEAFGVALDSADPKSREEAAYGQSLAYLRAGLANDASVAATKAPMNHQRAAELQVAILADRALSAFEGKRYHEALLYLDQRAQLQQERVDLMVLRGYCYLNLKMYDDAERIFTAVAATGSRDGSRGLRDLQLTLHPPRGEY
ncbi:cellulose synthesis protein (plasmid) [Rhizobium tropici CIAT 899]|uniref:Tetratricopeptide (TPR) repeat protein n=1 Tax=Rhizobium tropici TaxID=398 RepID=A0ABR6QZJ8_RHITR|nr:cellulose synthesis protein [Rhizobium tropici CIAT 899]MBB4242039.1 tetratricopeptide (TPR) repeat protein [Rhizobium tropici]MBB5593936.1 tetratricopeptide (TPR) repeat protein [Rhizobium tropici]MBB6492364.1 tetratricopeptide (TPR) repeat protein [Rhizobium tropici]